MSRELTLLASGLGLSVGLMRILDPNRGRRRRALDARSHYRLMQMDQVDRVSNLARLIRGCRGI